MFSILLLSALVAGQCDTKACPAPSYAVKTYLVQHEGVNLPVRGYFRPETGKIVWDRDDEYNRRSLAAAFRPVPVAPPVVVRPADRPVPAPKKDTAVDVVTNPFLGLPARAIQNFGMEPGKMIHKRDTYTANSPEARRFVQEAKSTDGPTGLLHVTVIGSDDEIAPVVNDLRKHPAFAPLKSSLLIQGYAPDEWPVDPSLGFVTTGKPTILVQTAKGTNDQKGGRVVYRATDYSMGPEALAEAIRKLNPDYKPSSDPGPANAKPFLPSSCPLGFTKDHWPAILAVGIVTLILYTLPRKGV